jgi:hypothetical protein
MSKYEEVYQYLLNEKSKMVGDKIDSTAHAELSDIEDFCVTKMSTSSAKPVIVGAVGAPPRPGTNPPIKR